MFLQDSHACIRKRLKSLTTATTSTCCTQEHHLIILLLYNYIIISFFVCVHADFRVFTLQTLTSQNHKQRRFRYRSPLAAPKMATNDAIYVVKQRIRAKVGVNFSMHNSAENASPMLKRQLSIPEECPPALKRSLSSGSEVQNCQRQRKKLVDINTPNISDSSIKSRG